MAESGLIHPTTASTPTNLSWTHKNIYMHALSHPSLCTLWTIGLYILSSVFRIKIFSKYLLLFSRSVIPDSLQPHGLQHARLPCPLPTPRAGSNWCPLSRWCHQTISSSVVPFSSCLQSFPASGSFLMSQLFTSDVQSISVNIIVHICSRRAL